MPRKKKKVEKKKRTRLYRTDAMVKKIMKEYRAAPWGKKADVLYKHGVTYGHICHWKKSREV